MHHIITLLGATCCVPLVTLLPCVAPCCEVLGVPCNSCRCCSCLARPVQQCCAWACAPVRFSIPNMSQHVPTGWPNVHNMLCPTMLGHVAFNCCDHLAGAFKCRANNVGICCVEMLRLFDQGLISYLSKLEDQPC